MSQREGTEAAPAIPSTCAVDSVENSIISCLNSAWEQGAEHALANVSQQLEAFESMESVCYNTPASGHGWVRKNPDVYHAMQNIQELSKARAELAATAASIRHEAEQWESRTMPLSQELKDSLAPIQAHLKLRKEQNRRGCLDELLQVVKQAGECKPETKDGILSSLANVVQATSNLASLVHGDRNEDEEEALEQAWKICIKCVKRYVKASIGSEVWPWDAEQVIYPPALASLHVLSSLVRCQAHSQGEITAAVFKSIGALYSLRYKALFMDETSSKLSNLQQGFEDLATAVNVFGRDLFAIKGFQALSSTSCVTTAKMVLLHTIANCGQRHVMHLLSDGVASGEYSFLLESCQNLDTCLACCCEGFHTTGQHRSNDNTSIGSAVPSITIPTVSSVLLQSADSFSAWLQAEQSALASTIQSLPFPPVPTPMSAASTAINAHNDFGSPKTMTSELFLGACAACLRRIRFANLPRIEKVAVPSDESENHWLELVKKTTVEGMDDFVHRVVDYCINGRNKDQPGATSASASGIIGGICALQQCIDTIENSFDPLNGNSTDGSQSTAAIREEFQPYGGCCSFVSVTIQPSVLNQAHDCWRHVSQQMKTSLSQLQDQFFEHSQEHLRESLAQYLGAACLRPSSFVLEQSKWSTGAQASNQQTTSAAVVSHTLSYINSLYGRQRSASQQLQQASESTSANSLVSAPGALVEDSEPSPSPELSAVLESIREIVDIISTALPNARQSRLYWKHIATVVDKYMVDVVFAEPSPPSVATRKQLVADLSLIQANLFVIHGSNEGLAPCLQPQQKQQLARWCPNMTALVKLLSMPYENRKRLHWRLVSASTQEEKDMHLIVEEVGCLPVETVTPLISQ